MKILQAFAVSALVGSIAACGTSAVSQAVQDTESGPTSTFVDLGLPDADALLFRPAAADARGIALLFAHPSGNSFKDPLPPAMASRGFPTLVVNRHADTEDPDELFFAAMSDGIKYLHTVEGIDRVILIGHSGGGHLAAYYQNVAENGAAACSGPEKLYPCDVKRATGLEPADGLALIDSTLGAFHDATSIDPAYVDDGQHGTFLPEADMFAGTNGYDPETGEAHYSPAFIKAFNAAQAKRSMSITSDALEALDAIKNGTGRYSDDAPSKIDGMGLHGVGARIYQPDTSLQAHTKEPHPVSGVDGAIRTEIVQSVRAPNGERSRQSRGNLSNGTRITTVRNYLSNTAIRFNPDYEMGEDDITGIDWASAVNSTPSNVAGIHAPTLVMVMTCHYLVVPGEIIFDHLATNDKSFLAIEGATHVFTPCSKSFGDTPNRTFDALAAWLDEPGRFGSD